MKRSSILRCVGIAMLLVAAAFAQSARAQSRGELLYTTHCIACHTTQMHWRDNRLAKDWNGLAAQVRRWQGTALLNWSEPDILEVTRYLNESIYRFTPPAPSTGSLGSKEPLAAIADRVRFR
jgi:mono/diheme cytochrome c family protein